MTTRVDLHDSEFIQTIGGHASALLKRTWPNGPSADRAATTPNAGDDYVVRCLVAASELAGCCDRIDHALVFLSGYARREDQWGKPISRHSYITFQMENLYFRLTMSSDRALKLVNEVYRLGLPARECRMSTVAKNTNLQHTGIREALERFESVVAPHRKDRNQLVHQRRFASEDLEFAEMHGLLEEAGGSSDIDLKAYSHTAKVQADTFIKERRSEFYPVLAALSQRASDLFELLLPRYERTYTALRGAPTAPATDGPPRRR